MVRSRRSGSPIVLARPWRFAAVSVALALVALLLLPYTCFDCVRETTGDVTCDVRVRSLVGVTYSHQAIPYIASAAPTEKSDGVRFLNVGGYTLYERVAIQQQGDHESAIIDGVNRLALGDSSAPFHAWQGSSGGAFAVAALLFVALGLAAGSVRPGAR